MSISIQMTMTESGHAALWNATNNGLHLDLTHVQLGSGNRGADGSETALLFPRQFSVIGAGTRISPTQIRIRSLFKGDNEFPVSEIGIWSGEPGADGSILVSYWAKEAGSLFEKSAGVDFLFVYDMVVASTIPAESITIISDPDQAAFLTLIEYHESNPDAHPGYVTQDELSAAILSQRARRQFFASL